MSPWDDQVTDEELVERARNGDLESYSELVCRYQQKIYRTIYRFTGNHADTDDLTQETFLRGFKKLGRFRGESGFYTWIYRIAVNLSLNFVKKRLNEKRVSELDEGRAGREEFAAAAPEAESASRELARRVEEAIQSLPLPYRSCFVLVALQGMSHAEAARVLGCAENTVAWRMHKARKLLQGKLKPYLGRGER